MQRISLLEDMRVECQQRQILEHYVHQAPPELFGVEMVGSTYIEMIACVPHALLAVLAGV